MGKKENDGDAQRSYWSLVGCGGQIYETKGEAIFDAIEKYRVHTNSCDGIPSVLFIQEWRLLSLPENFGRDVLNNLLCELDESYQDDDFYVETTTQRMRDAEKAFLEVVRSEYEVTRYESAGYPVRLDYEQIHAIANSVADKQKGRVRK